MSVLLQCKNINKEYLDKKVLKNVNIDIYEGECIGIVGANGEGKTTLINILLGVITEYQGYVKWAKDNYNIGYLKQCTDYSIDDFHNLYKTGGFDEFLNSSSRLGLDRVAKWDDQRFMEMSGGEKTKLSLASVLSHKQDIVFLDEPTNNLDFKGIDWLIDRINGYQGTSIIISHDRYFLDSTVNRIIEVRDGRVKSYKGNYTSYSTEKQHEYDTQMNAYLQQEKDKAKINREITTLRSWSSKAHNQSMIKQRANQGKKEYFRAKAKKKDKQIKSRIKRLERMKSDNILKPVSSDNLNFDITISGKTSRRILEASNISKAYGDKILFQNSSFYIMRGDRIGLVGSNGAGKTTLLKIIMNEKQLDSGEIWVHKGANISYISQDVYDLDMKASIYESFTIDSKESRSKISTLLAKFGFSGAKLNQSIETLSLGEMMRVKLAQVIATDTDVLILDEPTNHLDIHSKEELQRALMTYTGTIILTTHDRYLLENTCNKLLVFDKDCVSRYESGFSRYMNDNVLEKSEVNIKDQRLILENRIAEVVSRLSLYTPEDEEYRELDEEFKELVKLKK